MARTLLIALTAFLAGCSSSSTSSSSSPSSSAPAQTAESGLPAGLQKLVGVRGRDGELGLQQLGYEFRNASQANGSSLTRWRKGGGCIEVTTTDGNYARIANVAANLCEADGSAVPASGNANALRTVCGVIVGGKTTRYLCEVEENRKGITKMKMPDTNIELVWKAGGKLDFRQDGANPVEAKYHEAEGETDIFVDARTFFYISNPQAAALEVKSFKP
jgi:hypothetical protein